MKLSKSEYTTRRTDLVDAIGMADAELKSASFKRSTGAATAEDVEKARNHAGALRDDLHSLELAWETACEHAQVEKRASIQREWSATEGTLQAELEKMRKAAHAIGGAADVIVDQLQAIDDASSVITRMMTGWSTSTDRDRLVDLRDAIKGYVSEVRAALRGALYTAGMSGEITRYHAARSSTEIVEVRAPQIERAAARFKPQIGADA